MLYRPLNPTDAETYQALRLRGLAEAPTAFISTVEEDSTLSMSVVAERLRHTADSAVFSAWSDGELCGIAGIRREGKLRLRHKAFLWGVYVSPSARGSGAGRTLVTMAMDYGREMGVRQINLGVNAKNLAALRLYESVGFHTYGLEKNFMCVEGEWQDELHMVCVLDHGSAASDV
ncbi:MAG: GNAT family N-acetyltransferase [Povalibacter sp.]